MVLSPLMTILLWISLARMCSAPVQPSTISSIRTPSCKKANSEQKHILPPFLYTYWAKGHRTHHKLLLCTSHGSSSLSILVCSDEQLDQSRDGTLFSKRCVVCRAESQITDQTNCRLGAKRICFQKNYVCKKYEIKKNLADWHEWLQLVTWYLYKRPMWRWVKKFNHHWQSIV